MLWVVELLPAFLKGGVVEEAEDCPFLTYVLEMRELFMLLVMLPIE
jgi:hypothetical protein